MSSRDSIHQLYQVVACRDSVSQGPCLTLLSGSRAAARCPSFLKECTSDATLRLSSISSTAASVLYFLQRKARASNHEQALQGINILRQLQCLAMEVDRAVHISSKPRHHPSACRRLLAAAYCTLVLVHMLVICACGFREPARLLEGMLHFVCCMLRHGRTSLCAIVACCEAL
jgi:hypothetical protein